MTEMNELADKLQEQYIKMCQHMRDQKMFICKCNGYNMIDGKKIYCDKYTISSAEKYDGPEEVIYEWIDNIVTNGDVYICDNCQKANKCFCDDHAPSNLVELYEDGGYAGHTMCIDCSISFNIESNEEIRPWKCTNDV